MKKILKRIIASFAMVSLMLASVAYAAGTNESTSIPTIQVTDRSLSSTSWSESVSISGGEQLSVQLHYYLVSGDSATDMRFSLENLNGRTFNAGATEVVSGSVKADNLSTSSGSASVTFTEKVRLDLYNVSWQKGGCSSVGCETALVDTAGNVLTSNGMTIGNVEGYTGSNWQGRHYNGNVIVTFRTTKIDDSTDPTDPVAPTVTTNKETSVDEDSGVLNGYVDFTSDVDSGEVYFQYGTSLGNLSNSTSRISRSSDGSFSQTISGLNDDTTYYFRAVTRGDDGNLYYGATRFFTTDDEETTNTSDEADVNTIAASSVDEDSARLNGEVTEGDNVEVWFAFDENDSTPSCSDSSQRESVSGSFDDGDDFSKVVTGLDENEEYFFRACVRGDDGDVVSGSIRSFTTDDEDDNNTDADADVNTMVASSVDEDSARLNGEVTEGDNVEVWFVYSTNSTPSCSSSTNRVLVSGDYDDGDDFSKVITGLNDNTRYYYRACALGDDGERVSGNIRNFTTDEDDDNNNSSNNISTVTRIASGVSTNSGTIRSFVNGEGSGTCFFQYGTTTAFGNTTNRVPVNLDSATECTTTLTGLRSNTSYFYRAVLEADGQTVFGGTQSFRTGSAPVVITPTRPVVTTPTRPTVVTPPVVTTPQQELEITKWVSSESDPEFDTFVRAEQEETVYYRVRVTNKTDNVLEDVTVIDRIPFYLELDTESRLDDDSEKQVRWFLSRLQPGETKTYITEMRVRDDARDGDEIESFASASNDDFSFNSNDVVIEVTEQESEVVSEKEDNNQAASIFGAGFFPTDLLGWLLLFVVVLAIAYLASRILFSNNQNRKVLEELRAIKR